MTTSVKINIKGALKVTIVGDAVEIFTADQLAVDVELVTSEAQMVAINPNDKVEDAGRPTPKRYSPPTFA